MSSDRPRLSLAILVRDDATGLASALASAARFADEVVVRDTGSTDGSREVAESAGAHLVTGHFRDDFAEARNRLLDAASGDWVLMLDSDERIVSGGERLPRLLLDPRAVAYAVEVESATGFGRIERDGPVRLFRRTKDVAYRGRVHERLEVRRARAADVRIEHSGFLPSRRFGKARRDLALLSLDLRDAPNDPYLHWRLGRDLDLLGREGEASEALERMVALLDPLDGLELSRLDWVPEAVSDWAETMADRGVPRLALGLATRTALAHPDRPLARFAHARVLALAGRASDAARAVASLLEPHNWRYASPVEGDVLREHAPKLRAALDAA